MRVALGATPGQQDLFRSTAGFCDTRVDPDSIYGVLHRECFRLLTHTGTRRLLSEIDQKPTVKPRL
jgi:hypothetical protein